MATKNEDLIRSLGRIEGKIEELITSLQGQTGRMNRIDEDIEDVRKDLQAVQKDIRKDMHDLSEKVAGIDKKQYAIVVLATAVWSIIVMLIKKYL